MGSRGRSSLAECGGSAPARRRKNKPHFQFFRSLLGLAIGLLLLLGAGAAHGHATRRPLSTAERQAVIAAMEEAGHPRDYLERIFLNSRLRKLDAAVGFNVINKEAQRDYSEFLQPYALRMARRFKRRYRKLLARTERAHGVPRNILVALLLVETQFGRARQPYRVLEVYASLVVDTGEDALRRHYRRLKPHYPELERDYLRERLEQKREWALRELSALIAMGVQNGTDIARLRGSYAGAFGMSQFLPSSYLRWGADGNGDGKVYLNQIPDALFSVAAYLKAHGWTEDADSEQMRRAVWEYNHSPQYVEAIFAVRRALAPPAAKAAPPATSSRQGETPPESGETRQGDAPAGRGIGGADDAPPQPAGSEDAAAPPQPDKSEDAAAPSQ